MCCLSETMVNFKGLSVFFAAEDLDEYGCHYFFLLMTSYELWCWNMKAPMKHGPGDLEKVVIQATGPVVENLPNISSCFWHLDSKSLWRKQGQQRWCWLVEESNKLTGTVDTEKSRWSTSTSTAEQQTVNSEMKMQQVKTGFILQRPPTS